MSLIPVILGSDINGLGLSRSFGQEKINSIVLDFKKNIADKLNFVTREEFEVQKKIIEKLQKDLIKHKGKKLKKKKKVSGR